MSVGAALSSFPGLSDLLDTSAAVCGMDLCCLDSCWLAPGAGAAGLWLHLLPAWPAHSLATRRERKQPHYMSINKTEIFLKSSRCTKVSGRKGPEAKAGWPL